nr:Bacterial regulatory proteins, tetR family [uncultured bacterium]
MYDVTEHLPVAAAMRATRQARGISLRALAATVGVSPATLSAVERGLTSISVARLESVAAALDVPADQLLRGEPALAVDRQSEKNGARSAHSIASARDYGAWRDFDTIRSDAILEAATMLFVSQGFHASSMREVASSAGLSVSGIYHHYPSKESILVALLDLTMGEITWRLEAARHEGATPVESFALMVESLALFHAVRGDLAFLGASEMRGLGNAERIRVTALRDAVQHALDDQAMACVAAGEFHVGDVRVACRAIATMCTALPSWFQVDGPLGAPEVARRYASYALALVGWNQPTRRDGNSSTD